jgi:hypothetical protein
LDEEKEKISQKYIVALQGIAKSVNSSVPLKNKHNFIRPLRSATLTLSQAKKLGFNCGKRLWINSVFDKERLPGGDQHWNKIFKTI